MGQEHHPQDSSSLSLEEEQDPLFGAEEVIEDESVNGVRSQARLPRK